MSSMDVAGGGKCSLAFFVFQ